MSCIMANATKPEVWLRGPLIDIPDLLQPVAHALLQAREEVGEMLKEFPATKLWSKPAGIASVGFHLQHLTGVLDRLFTYAKGEGLNQEQLQYLSAEGKAFDDTITVAVLLDNFNKQVDCALADLSAIDDTSLISARGVGRGQVPSTVIGLLVHSAEHTMRHVGQLHVTVKVLQL